MTQISDIVELLHRILQALEAIERRLEVLDPEYDAPPPTLPTVKR